MAVASYSDNLLFEDNAPKELAEWGGIYRKRLGDIGLMRSHYKVDQVELSSALSKFYESVLQYLPAACRRLGTGGWPEQIVRTHRKAFHPLLHVMLQVFLDRSTNIASPFGVPPWPCLNPLAEHQGARVIDRLNYHRNRNTLVGVFTCHCGYVYTRCRRSDGQLDAPRMQTVGPLFGPALRHLLVPGCTLRGTARTLGVDPKTLMREALSLGIPVGWSMAPSGKPRSSPQPAEHNSSEPSSSVARTSHGKPRRDWLALDLQLVCRVNNAAGLVRAILPPVRVTRAELERHLGMRGWLRKRLVKLPLANAAAVHLSEPVEAFRRRRVRHVIASRQSLAALEPWRIMRMAGLVGSDLTMVQEEVASYVAICNETALPSQNDD